MNNNFAQRGDSVKITALPGLYTISVLDGMIGIVMNFDEEEKIYDVYVDGKIIQLIEEEFQLIDF